MGAANPRPPRVIGRSGPSSRGQADGLGRIDFDKPTVLPYVRVVKTTIEIPDLMVRQARLLAVERRTTLRALVLEGLERVLSEERLTARERAKNLFAAMDKVKGIDAGKRLNRADAHAR